MQDVQVRARAQDPAPLRLLFPASRRAEYEVTVRVLLYDPGSGQLQPG